MFIFKEYTNEYFRIPLKELGEEAFSVYVSPNEYLEGEVKVRVDGPGNYDSEGHLNMYGVIGSYTVYV